MMKFFSAILILCLSHAADAVTCYMTLVKDTCWLDYTVSVHVSDAIAGTPIATVTAPKGQAWVRSELPCSAGETLALAAQFTPAVWSGDEEKTFAAQRYWQLPKDIENGVTGWNVTVCYPKWFSGVPMPPNATAHCSCNTEGIPPVKPPAT